MDDAAKLKPPRGRRVTSYDVAVAAGVSQSTVSRCFELESQISPETRARVQAVAAALGYVPNALARSLILQRSDMVAAIVTEFTLRTNPALVNGIGRALAANGKQLLLMTAEDDAGAREAARVALRYPLDGLIVAAMLGDVDIKPFLSRGVAIVFFNRPVALPRVDRVGTDHAGASRQVASLLHAAGHRQYVCLGGPADWVVNQERASGLVDRLAELGVRHVPIIHSPPSYSGGRQVFLSYLRSKKRRPDAVFCVNDQLAFGVLDACRFDMRLTVPDDISVVGFDDVAEASHQSYDLTTVRQDIERMAGSAVELLLRRIEKPGAPARALLLPGAVVHRGSARL